MVPCGAPDHPAPAHRAHEAALEADAAGVQLILLERQSGGGGSSALPGGEMYLGGGAPIQQACGFDGTAVPFEPSLWDSPAWVPPPTTA
ncbi:hypothetical protein [Nocardia flavorosea]|uniref:hypothetical protein n=1 Tax=Nocardia flavorosea TaxID=53429 RepID=UPI0007A411C4|nr:hypothetical protein [Nocardia flavorosea]